MQIGWSEKVTSKELCSKVQPERNLLQEVTQRKLEWSVDIGTMDRNNGRALQ